MSVSEIDIYRSAQLLINQHGNSAASVAYDRAKALSCTGDMEGEATFLRIVQAIKILQTEPSSKLN